MSSNRVLHSGPGAFTDVNVDAFGRLVARYGLVIVIVWIGGMKFTYYESHAISPLVINSPLMSWIYHIVSIRTFGVVLGVLELAAAVLLVLNPWVPRLSIIGGALATVFFLTTISFMITTPGVGEASAGGFPVLSALGKFLVKDIALLGLALWAITDSISAMRRRGHPVESATAL